MSVTVQDLGLVVLAGRRGLGRAVADAQLREPDLAAPESDEQDASGGVLHLRPGQTNHLCSLARTERLRLVRAVLRRNPAAVVVSGAAVCRELLDKAEALNIPVLKCRGVQGLRRLLAERLAPRVSIHGVLVQIFGLGTIIRGESAVGKSEAALDLVLRGHKLVADDVVVLEKKGGVIIGTPAEMGENLLQIRGLGIINVRALYGASATARACRVGLIVELKEWEKGRQYSLVGLREQRQRILGVNVPYLKLPVKPGRNMATLIEVAARNQMLKNRGVFTAREFNKNLIKRLSG